MLDYLVAEQFTDVPGGRYRRLGKFSGEAFRDDVVVSLLRDNEKVTFYLDGTEGYPSSFLEECFGGLVRHGFEKKDLKKKLKFVAEDPAFKFYIDEIWDYISDAELSKQNDG